MGRKIYIVVVNKSVLLVFKSSVRLEILKSWQLKQELKCPTVFYELLRRPKNIKLFGITS